MLCDRIKPERGSVARDYEKTPYRVLFAGANAKEARIKLVSDNGPLSIEKEISLEDGSSQVRIDYALTNPSTHNFIGSFWSCSLVHPGTGNSCNVFFPEGNYSGEMNAALQKRGIHYFYDSSKAGNYFVNSPRRDYIAAVGKRVGVVLTAPFEYLESFYSYQPDRNLQSALMPTLEFFTHKILLRPLSQGKADAVNHPEVADPLADYICRFSILIQPVKVQEFNYFTFRKTPLASPSNRFRPPLEEAVAFTQYNTPAIPFFPAPREKN